VYVGNAESNEIYVLQLDRRNGDLSVVEKVAIPGIEHAHQAEGIPDGQESELDRDHRSSLRQETPMARIEPLGMHEVDDDIRHVCEESERQSGTSASSRTYARNPGVVKALAAFRTALAREGTIDPVLRELVRLKIAALNGCRY
jgi:hypothetical protein